MNKVSHKTNKPTVTCSMCKQIIGAAPRVQVNDVAYKGVDAKGITVWHATRLDTMHKKCYEGLKVVLGRLNV